MNKPIGSQLYTAGSGIAPSKQFVFPVTPRDPSIYDVGYDIYQGWINTDTKAIWYLEGFTTTDGITTALWRAVGPIVTKDIDRTIDPPPPASTANPTTSDYLYPLGQTWVNIANNSYWVLVDVTGSTATWIQISGGGGNGIDSITGDSGGAVFGSSTNNVNLVGTAGQITVTGNPGTNTLTLALAGGSTAVDSFAPDTGTSPVVPTAAGLINIKGQNPANVSGIQVTGALNELDISMVSPFKGDFIFTDSIPGNIEQLTAQQTDNTDVGSHACVKAEVAGTSGGDAFFACSVAGAPLAYGFGIANQVSGRPLQISTSASNIVAPGQGTALWKMRTGGARTMPLQPAFLATLSATVTNATGDGTVYTIIFDTEDYDQNGNYDNTTGIFTAPVDGKYCFTSGVRVSQLGAGHTGYTLTFATTTRSMITSQLNPGALRDDSNRYLSNGTIEIDLLAGSTVSITVQVTNSTKTVSVDGDPNIGLTYFSGFLMC